MKFYFAPMEGITGYIYRNAFHETFSGADKYYTPFLAPNRNACLKTRELQDILPEHNKGICLVPQILTNNAEDFNRTAKELKEYGYEEINLNLGCPSGTVVAKRKGAGFLAEPILLEQFLDEIFAKQVTKISIKTRIGKDCAEEFEQLLKIFNKYPLCELIIHPRIQKEQYKNKPNREVFRFAVKNSKNPLCYNGDIYSVSDYQGFRQDFPEVCAVMLGRGLIANPGLLGEIRKEKPASAKQMIDFHKKLCEGYQKVLSGDRDVLFKMKEVWHYLSGLFPEPEKSFKKIRKANTLKEYQIIVQNIMQSYPQEE